MISIVRDLLVDGEDSLYLYHPKLIESVILHGDQIGAIGNYDTDGWNINLNFAFRQTLYVLMAEDPSLPKYLIYLTDRIIDAKPLEKALKINDKEMIDCHFVLIGVGDFYNKNILAELSDKSNVSYIHVDDPIDLKSSLFKEKDNGQDNPQCTPSEQCQFVQLTSGYNNSISRPIRSSDAIDGEPVQINEEQLLQTDFS
jgi:hypothetical protein